MMHRGRRPLGEWGNYNVFNPCFYLELYPCILKFNTAVCCIMHARGKQVLYGLDGWSFFTRSIIYLEKKNQIDLAKLIATFILWIFGTLSNSVNTYIRILHRAGRVRIHSLRGLPGDR